MTVRRKTAGIAALGFAPLVLTMVSAGPAAAHGSMSDPVSRISTCFAEGPESPKSEACKAALQASGPQAFYDWNEVNIPDAAGKHKEIIPDGKLCSAGRDKYKGLDLPRADWPASEMKEGKHTFSYKATAPHKGTIDLYITKDGYDPAKPLKWSDLEEKPFASVTNPTLKDGSYVFDGTVPKKSGRHLIYSTWQRSDSPEAFYTCSDVTFGGEAPGDTPPETAAPAPAAPGEEQIVEGLKKSTVDHQGHGGKHPTSHANPTVEPSSGNPTEDANAPDPKGGSEKAKLAETGGESNTAPLAIGGAAIVAAGAGLLIATSRRRAAKYRG
ncbi:lytic polysaccharide monooxygenase [Streptomyces sp. NBC_01775]|uniref:lytic polysaccharide monooxygenase auxiliary activity family 9 protein n=1 Tax=Streptomyces sp. NBC_01775 TaxID=2975939 RepID=UPI002DDB82B3|nr:lytic polysaccharide monooxygenase [Streptomyces sp. NBC_01775]WSB80193.1 lytic polysaccharide monooxygenase [Streptomyces sp. NBC_01775]